MDGVHANMYGEQAQLEMSDDYAEFLSTKRLSPSDIKQHVVLFFKVHQTSFKYLYLIYRMQSFQVETFIYTYLEKYCL